MAVIRTHVCLTAVSRRNHGQNIDCNFVKHLTVLITVLTINNEQQFTAPNYDEAVLRINLVNSTTLLSQVPLFRLMLISTKA